MVLEVVSGEGRWWGGRLTCSRAPNDNYVVIIMLLLLTMGVYEGEGGGPGGGSGDGEW